MRSEKIIFKYKTIIDIRRNVLYTFFLKNKEYNLPQIHSKEPPETPYMLGIYTFQLFLSRFRYVRPFVCPPVWVKRTITLKGFNQLTSNLAFCKIFFDHSSSSKLYEVQKNCLYCFAPPVTSHSKGP